MSSDTVKHSTIPDELKSGKTVTYFTIGVSMRPLLTERKTHVMIAPLTEAKPRDIVLYIRKNGDHVLHRCMKTAADCYYMRGDNTYGLERIEKEQAVGVVTHIYRKGRCFAVKNNPVYSLYVTFWNAIYPLRWLKVNAKRLTVTAVKAVLKPFGLNISRKKGLYYERKRNKD